MSKFDPPKPQALAPSDLVQTIASFGADSAGVAKAVELIQIQEALKIQDSADLQAWAVSMASNGSTRARAALRKAGFDETGKYLGADILPTDINDQLPESETRVENTRIVLPTGIEDQYAERVQNGSQQITRKGKVLSSPAAALETATADVATYYHPKSRLIDELPLFATGAGFAAIFGYVLSGMAEPFSLVVGFLLGAILSLGLSRFGAGFPGIFALTSFGVVGARLLRGLLGATGVLALVLASPQAESAGTFVGSQLFDHSLLWASNVILSIALGLLVSGKRGSWLRLAISSIAVVLVGSFAALFSYGFSVPNFNFSITDVLAGGLAGLFLNATLSFASTSGGIRYHSITSAVSTLLFGIFCLLSFAPATQFSLVTAMATIGFSLAASFATSSTSAGRFWSVISGAVVGCAAVVVSYLAGVSPELILAAAVALTAGWFASISFDSAVRKNRLHLASLNRSYGFYGSVSWLAIAVFLIGALLSLGLSLLAPGVQDLPVVFMAPLLTFLAVTAFSLMRIPQIRSQEEEIVLALSRNHSATQVGIQ